MQLEPKKYYWKNRKNQINKSLGLIAQEVALVVPEIVHGKETSEEYLSVNYTELIPILIKGMQEQQELIKQLQEELKAKDKASNDIQTRLDRLEALVTINE